MLNLSAIKMKCGGVFSPGLGGEGKIDTCDHGLSRPVKELESKSTKEGTAAATKELSHGRIFLTVVR